MTTALHPSTTTDAGRRTISMWRLTVWAYRTQMVQYEVDRFRDQRSVRSLVDDLGYRSGVIEPRGCINGAGTTAHDDAHILHRHVRKLPSAESAAVVRAGAQGATPAWSPLIPALRVVPARKAGGGSLRMIYGRRHAPIGCAIEYEGIPDDEAEAIRARARREYSIWWHGLSRLLTTLRADRSLSLWKVEGAGANPEPWLDKMGDFGKG